MDILLLAAMLALQSTTGTVVAVTVDVTVVDGSGRPVPGLGADSFAVELDGQRRRIVTLTYLPSGAPMRGAIGPAFDAVTPGAPVYRLVVQPPDGTAVGREFAVAVTVNRPGAKVEAPPRVAAAPVTVTGTLSATAPGAAKSTEERLREALAAGRMERGIPIRVARAVTRGTEPSNVTLHFGFYVPASRPVLPLFAFVHDRGVHIDLVPLERERETYMGRMGLLLQPGAYKVRFGVVDDAGALGVVELTGNAQLHRMGPLLASDLVRWTWDNSHNMMPAVDEIPAFGVMSMSLELYPVAGAATPPDVLVKMEFAGIERIVTPDSRDGKLVANAEFPVDRIPPGTYTVQATVLSAASPLGTVTSTLIKR